MGNAPGYPRPEDTKILRTSSIPKYVPSLDRGSQVLAAMRKAFVNHVAPAREEELELRLHREDYDAVQKYLDGQTLVRMQAPFPEGSEPDGPGPEAPKLMKFKGVKLVWSLDEERGAVRLLRVLAVERIPEVGDGAGAAAETGGDVPGAGGEGGASKAQGR